MDRRLMLQGLMAVCGVGSLSACGDAGEKPVGAGSSGPNFTQAHRAFLVRLSDIIIPTTDSPGALIAGVPAKVELVITDMMSDGPRTEWLAGLTAVHKTLDLSVGGSFLKASPANQINVVKKMDAAAFNSNMSAPTAYRNLKDAIATAYYWSEPGATEELQYDPVPGDWKACVPLAEIGRTWAH